MTILQAIEEVLRPRRRDIACLFSDIRGFTRATKGDADSFVDEGVIPNVKECTYAIERNGGIPRKIGDLLFAYFDQPDSRENLIHCLCAATEVIRVNNEFNSLRPERSPINRYVLMTSGEATVGNLGGFDSSIEITALGNPVNLLSRIDEATKHPSIRHLITNNHVVMDERTAITLSELLPTFKAERLNLTQFGVRIRDFETVDQIFLFSVDARPDRTKTHDETDEPGINVGNVGKTLEQVQAIRA